MGRDSVNKDKPPAKRKKLDVDPDTGGDSYEDFSKDTLESDAKDFTVSSDKYTDFVNPEELEKLREFKVLDEVKSNDEDSEDEESDSSDGKSVPDEEIDRMLEENLPEELRGAPKPKEKSYVTRQKIVLEEKGVNHFEVLPLDWTMVRHCSGMPVYMHRTSRVCTLSKPYFLGTGNTRRHDIPMSSIPCYAYRRALEEEEKQKEIDRKIEEQIRTGAWANAADTNTNSDKEPNLHDENPCAKETNKEEQIEKSKTHKFHKKANSKETLPGPSTEIIKQPSPTKSEPDSKFSEETAYSSINPEISMCPFSKEAKSLESQSKLDEASSETKPNIDEPICTVSSEASEAKISDSKDLKASEPDNSEVTETKAASGDGLPAHIKPVVLPGGLVMPPPRVETVNTSWKTQHLPHDQVNNYCKKLFKFKTVNIMHFKRWADRRKYTKARKALQYPTLPEGTKLITIPAQPGSSDNGGKATKRDWVMNINGCSYLSVFHEYVRRALQSQPVYEFRQLENAATPYQATVCIGGMQYGVGHGSSKRQAKSAAARASIHILIPEMRAELDAAARRPADTAPEPDLSFFDYVAIEDPRITEFCSAASEPSPHAILRTCLLRNFGANDKHIHTEMKKLEYQQIELTMKVGKHSATVVCKNKKIAKQRASQAILQALHPHVQSWGSLLRLYGSRSIKSCKEKKLEEQQITLLQDKARRNQPNRAVLDKLRHEMDKLRERDAAVVPIGTLLLRDPPPSAAGLDHVDL